MLISQFFIILFNNLKKVHYLKIYSYNRNERDELK